MEAIYTFKQKGFFIPILGVVIIVIVIVIGIYYLNSRKTVSTSSVPPTKTTSIPVSSSGNYNNDLKSSLQKAFK